MAAALKINRNVVNTMTNFMVMLGMLGIGSRRSLFIKSFIVDIQQLYCIGIVANIKNVGDDAKST